jgi:hypothetical protein
LVGYSADRPLHSLRLLEPSFGGGDFLLAAVKRLLNSWRAFGTGEIEELVGAIHAVELHRQTFESTRAALSFVLGQEGFCDGDSARLVDAWLVHDDFLLTNLPSPFDVVVGNPPYIRQELIAESLLSEYRRRFQTLFDRADIYIPFIERSLTCLAHRGVLGVICADRWMKNQYGGPLRRFVSREFNLKIYVDMVGTDAFKSEVVAYPAITVIAREPRTKTRTARRPQILSSELSKLSTALLSVAPNEGHSRILEIAAVGAGTEPGCWNLPRNWNWSAGWRPNSRQSSLQDAR